MADPRFYGIAKRMGHVYLDRLAFQGPEIQRREQDGNLMAEVPRVELFRSAMLAPMDPRDFLDTFFAKWAKYVGKPGGHIHRPYSAVPPTASYRQFIVDPLVSHCHLASQFLSPSHPIPCSSTDKIQILNYESPLTGFRSSGDIVFCDRAKLHKSKRSNMPDIVAVSERFQFVVDESKSSDKPLEIDDMGLAEYFITIQPNREDDFFHDPAPGTDHLSDPNGPSLRGRFVALSHILDPEEREKVTHRLEQMIKRVEEVWVQQQRTHLFTISMAGSMARFLCWDRSGIVVTRAFDIRQQPKLLHDFLSLYYRSSRAVRGYDTTVRWAGSADSSSENKPKWAGGGTRRAGGGGGES